MSTHKNSTPSDSRQLSLWNDEQNQQTPFERIKHTDATGEYWLARELMPLLDYTDWRNFKRAIGDAQKSCETSGKNASQNFGLLKSTIQSGKGRKQQIDDYRLSRYACYLILQNGDPGKQAIADAQAYFAVQTRRAELSAAEQKKLKHNQDVTGYQLHGYSQDTAVARVESKESQKPFSNALIATKDDHSPDFAGVGAAQNKALFNKTKRQMIEYLGLLPKDEPKYRDFLGIWALRAVKLANAAAARQMTALGRALTDEEQKAVVKEQAELAARLMRSAAEMEGIDFLSGAPLDDNGNALIVRNVKLLKG